jgi:CubicO group peptidase (beta-lactamase class C family)
MASRLVQLLGLAITLSLWALHSTACDRTVDAPKATDRGNAAAGVGMSQLQGQLDVYLDKQVSKNGIPGLSVSVVRDGKVIYAGARGVRKLGEREQLTPRHVFHLASISKTFAATAVMQLVEQGTLKLDDKLTSVLPYFRLADPRYRDITIRRMLNHTAGLPPGDVYEWDRPQFDDGAAERYVRSLTSQGLLWAPGGGWRYSDLGPDIMADVIAKASGMTFETYARTKIFEPLGMSSSSFYYKELAENLRTTGHVDTPPRVSDVYPYNRRHAPSSTLTSSVVDMARWMLANLNRGELDDRRILQATSYDLLWTPTVRTTPPNESPPVHIGLGWFISEHAGRRTIFHGGGDIGFRSFVLLVPDERIGIALASNWQQTPRETLVTEILDMVLKTGKSN